MSRIFIARPGYGSGASNHTEQSVALGFLTLLRRGHSAEIVSNVRSLLANNFNTLWCTALNRPLMGAEPFDWFVMLHSDMGSPDLDWILRLIDTADANGLDAVAANAMIKDRSGDVSTALLDHGTGEIHRYPAAAMREFPPVITDAWAREHLGGTLCLNTGMLALRLGREWNGRFFWRIEDRIERLDDGYYTAKVIPEDWRMSLEFAKWGVPYGVDQEIVTVHGDEYVWDYYERGIEGWMDGRDLRTLAGLARGSGSFVEVGAWKGRTTDCLTRWCPGTVYAVDTFEGTPGQLDGYPGVEGAFDAFQSNVGGRENLVVLPMTSLAAADAFAREGFPRPERVFIDADHSFGAVSADLAAWEPLATKWIGGHDIDESGVRAAVDLYFGPDGWERLSPKLWGVDLEKRRG